MSYMTELERKAAHRKDRLRRRVTDSLLQLWVLMDQANDDGVDIAEVLTTVEEKIGTLGASASGNSNDNYLAAISDLLLEY